MSDSAAMPAHEVIALYRAATAAGVRLWVDGGWCVDAVVGRQTREHDDLDIAVDREDTDGLVAVLTAAGYQHDCAASSSEWNFVMTNDIGRNDAARGIECGALVDEFAGRANVADAARAHSPRSVSL